MSIFNFSRRNLVRYTQNILALFQAADSDLDNFETAINNLSSDIEDIRGAFIDGDVEIIVTDDTLYDSTNTPVLDSSGDESIRASIIYRKESESSSQSGNDSGNTSGGTSSSDSGGEYIPDDAEETGDGWGDDDPVVVVP